MPKLSDLIKNRDSVKEKLKQPVYETGKRSKSKQEQRFSYVAIDLETTGLNYRSDRITEIGLVYFSNGEVLKEYSSLVNPGRSIPPEVTDITGIDDEKVKDAPTFRSIADKVLEFIGNRYLCGHSVDFDFTFLNNELKRLKLEPIKNKRLDTASLSRLVLDGLSGYSLENVCRYLGVDLKNAHRALDDARACGYAADRMIPILNKYDRQLLARMAAFAPPSVLKDILRIKSGSEPVLAIQGAVPVKAPKLKKTEETQPVSESEIEAMFSENGRLSEIIKGYTFRECQLNMAKRVGEALNTGGHLITEAGTGTGKSFAYLIPSAIWTVKNSERVFVATRTRNLQDQLVNKEIPDLRKAAGEKLRYSVLKGRGNYICLNRWEKLINGKLGKVTARERFGFLPVMRWLHETSTGDIEELGQFNNNWFRRVWSLVSADYHGCSGRNCDWYNQCFLQNARKKAASSHIVVINHALFFSDLCSSASFLGKPGALIVDEAHHLESEGHRYLRVELDNRRVDTLAEDITSFSSVYVKEGGKKFSGMIKKFRKNGTEFLSEFSKRVILENGSDETAFALGYGSDFKEKLQYYSGFTIAVKEIEDKLRDIITEYREKDLEDSDSFNELKKLVDRISQLRADITYLVAADTPDHVFWAEGNTDKGWIKIIGVPLEIGDILSAVWNDLPSIHTSATLSIEGRLDYFKMKTGLDKVETIEDVFDSPYDTGNVMRAVMDPGKRPGEKEFENGIADIISFLMQELRKNTLVLFTSNDMMKKTADSIKERRLLSDDVQLLIQNLSGNRNLLIDKMNADENTLLFGTSSFWEGIDAPGKACEIVVIPRLPFSVPTHPLTKALSDKAEQEYGNSFTGFSLPEAVIRFRQGAGRLIRSHTDKGVLLVLDKRIAEKSYGRVFMNSVKGEFAVIKEKNELNRLTGDFFGS